MPDIATELTAEGLRDYATCWQHNPHRELVDQIKAFSMLHQETLLLLHYFASRVQGPALEIGPYIGGSTVAIATGLKASGGGPLITVEAGTSYAAHDQISTKDTVGDLQRNLRAFEVEDMVRIFRGWSVSKPTRDAVYAAIGSRLVHLFVVDADGYPGRDFWLFEPLLADGCIMAFDDYESETTKAATVSGWVNRAIARGLVTDLGVFQWNLVRHLSPTVAVQAQALSPA